MPNVAAQEAVENDLNDHEQVAETSGIWTRSRLIKNPNGFWVRVGRLRKVVYKD